MQGYSGRRKNLGKVSVQTAIFRNRSDSPVECGGVVTAPAKTVKEPKIFKNQVRLYTAFEISEVAFISCHAFA